jgi:hypothetical protein
MRRVANFFVVTAGLFLTAGTVRTDSPRQFVLIRSDEVAAHTDTDTTVGQYYTVSYDLPVSLRAQDLEIALLEIYMDVRAKPRLEYSNAPEGDQPEKAIEYVNEAPVIEVYALTQPYAGSVDLERFDAATRAVRPVALGTGRRVLIEITDILRGQLDGRIPNHGIVLGSLTGTRDGDFALVQDKLPKSAIGRLRIYTKRR